MRLTTKFSAFVTLLTGLTIFVTLLGCSLSFYNAIQYKFSHRVQAVATAIDTHLVSNDFSTLRPQITELMMSADIVRVDLLHGDKQVYTLARNGSYRPVGSSDLFRELSVPLIKHPGMSLRLVYQDPMGNYFHSLMTTAPLTGAIGFIIVMLFLAVRWLQRQLAGQELLETRATRILNGERGSNVLGTIYEWPPRTSSALDTLLREIQNAREQHSRLDTLIRSYAAQDVKTGLNNRLFFDNQLATLLEDQEKVGTHGIVMMIRLPDFNMLSDTWGHSQIEEQFFTLTNLLSTFMMRYPGALLARYHRSDFAALLPHRTLKEAESIAGQLIKAVDTLPNNKMLDRDDMIHIGICAWRSGQDTEQVMEHAESATRNAGLQGGNSWAIYDDSLPEKGRGNVRWRTLIEQMLSNVFVWLMLFSYFSVPAALQRRVLVYGVLGAIVLRTIMIFTGSWLISQFDWILYIFGAFLLFTGGNMKLLIVEDEKKTGEYLTKGLTEAGFVVDLADNGLNGYHLAMTGDYDLIILDIMLPDVNGWDIVRMLRSANKGMPILLLTALGTIEHRVKGLELGADDYLMKPFAFAELLARVRTLLRRGAAVIIESQFQVADLMVDLVSRKVTRSGNPAFRFFLAG